MDNKFSQNLILIFVFLHGSYEPSGCKRFFQSFGVLSSADEEEMNTRQYVKWKQYMDAAKQQLLEKQILVGAANDSFEIPPERTGEAFSRVADFLEKTRVEACRGQ